MSVITGRHLSRRTVLRGMGAAIALPVLDAMSPTLAAPAAKKAPLRLAFVYVPNGIVMKDWTPAATGKEFELTRILKPLEAFRQDMFVLTGLEARNGNALGDGAGDHARAGASFLTGAHPKKTAGADITNGISADQIAAQVVGARTRLASLEVGCEDSRTVGDCDSGYSCAYTNSISWRSATTPMPPEVNPRMVFERLFGSDAGLDPRARAQRLLNRRSILDLVREDTRRLVETLGPADRRKMDEYLTGVREIEKRIQRTEHDSRPVRPSVESPAGIPAEFAEYVKLMYDLQVAAFQADMTRVVTMMVGREGSNRAYPEIGVPDAHHPLTHHRNNPEWIEKVTKINVLHAEMFAYFLQRLKATPDGNGTLLDHAMIVYGSGLSDGNRHTHEELPILLAGRGGSLKPGRHLQYPRGTCLTNLYMTLLDEIGVRPPAIGDSTGEIEYLGDL